MNDNSFFSIDSLIEFGMSMAVAQQMVNTMNVAMSQMNVPGTDNQLQNSHNQFFYAIIEGNQAGPFTEQELKRLILDKKITKETSLWKPGLINWEIAEKLPEVLKLVALVPPPFIK